MARTPTGQTALITGASSGIGYELAKCFAEDGHDLVLVSRSRGELDAIAQELGAAYGIKAEALDCDLFQPDAARELYERVQERGITVEYLVNDAGQGVYGPFAETSLEDELRIIQLNVTSLVVLTKLFLKDMLARDRGRILQLGSIVSKNAAPWSAVYGGTKAFVYNFALGVIEEIRGSQVTMTVLRPGATDTDFFRKEGGEQMRLVQEGKLTPAHKVARTGYRAMMKGKASVVASLPNKLQDAAANLVPDSMVARRMGKMQEPKPGSSRH